MAAKVQAAAGQDLEFLTLLVELQAKLIGAVSGAVFAVRSEGELRLVTVYPMAENRYVKVDSERVDLLRDCVNRCIKAGQVSVYRVAMNGRMYYANCTPLESDGRVEGVTVVMTELVDQSELQPRLAHLEWAGRLYAGHITARRLRRKTREASEVRKALSVLAASDQAQHFREACMAVCNQFATEMNAVRVSLGWQFGANLKLMAVSGTDHIDERQEFSRRLVAAMEECFDQAQAVVMPVETVEDADELLTTALTRCHREYLEQVPNVTVCSVPLRLREEVVGVLTVERPRKQKLDSLAISHLQAMADLATPRLAAHADADRLLALKVWESLKVQLGKLIGPEHAGWKLAGIVVLAVLLYVCLFKWDYRVKGDGDLEPQYKRVYAAPFAGFIKQVWVDQNQPVKAGQELAQLDDRDLSAQRGYVAAQLEQKRLELFEAHRKASEGDTNQVAKAKQLAATVAMHEAQLALLDNWLADATLRAEQDGVVLAGDWKERIGSKVELGDAIFEVAPLEGLRLVVRVDERDIDRIELGALGEWAARGKPGEAIPFTVTRVVQVGQPHEGRNVFEVYGRLERREPWMNRPGLQGVARIDAGRERVIWIATHRLVDYVRLALW